MPEPAPAVEVELEPEVEPVDDAPPTPESVPEQTPGPVLAAPVRCPRCRAKLSPDSPICRLCGYRVDEAPAQAAAAPGLAEPKTTSEQKTLKDNVGYLISVSSVDGRETVKMPIKKGVNTLGRGKCDLPFQEDDLLSPVHLKVSVDEDGALLSTSDSRNGTFLRMTDQVQLKHGDQFRLGQQLLRYEDLDRLAPIVSCPDGEDDTQILGSPGGPKAWGRLTQVVSESLTASSFLLTSENVFLGRERGNITFPGDRYISGTHAVVTRKSDGTYLRDVGSSNGTYVRLQGDVRVASGQYFLAGRQLFKLYLEK